MFSNTDSISYDLSFLGNNKIKNMSHLFYNCDSLQNIDISKINMNEIEDISYMFGNCI